jgi:hypothetical protein
MRLHRLIETFTFTEDDRGATTLGTGMRLHPERQRLVPDGPPYPAAAEARTRVWEPQSVKQWLSFQAKVAHARVNGEIVTAAKFRLGDGTSEYYWDGGAWAVATTQWSTEAELSEHISSFSATARKLQVAVRLETTDTSVAAECVELKVLWSTAVHFLEDLVYRSLVRYLRNNVHPIADQWIKPGAATATIDLDSYPLRTPYNFLDVDSVFDLTDDPEQQVNLLSSYDPGTRVITLTGSLPQDHVALVRFTYEPEVAVNTSPEYHELAKLPVIELASISLVDAAEAGQRDSVVAVHDGSAVTEFPPIQGDLEVIADAVADKGVDMHRLVEELKRALINEPTLRSTALDRRYSLWLIEEYDLRTGAGTAEMHTGRVRFRVRDVTLHVRDSVDSYGVQRFSVTGTEDFVLAE